MLYIKTESVVKTSWEEIKAAVKAGTVKGLLHSRDCIPVALKNGEETTIVVAYNETGKMFFTFDNCLDDPAQMNARYTNAGGWAASKMRRHLNETVFALFPDDLQAVIEPTRIVQVIDGERVECEDKLFLLSKTQVFGKGPWSDYEPEDSPLDIFTGERSRVKERADYGTEWWWLRSPESSSSSAFADVNGNGSSYSNGASNSYGVAPGFCL